jgi:hypothetical protein
MLSARSYLRLGLSTTTTTSIDSSWCFIRSTSRALHGCWKEAQDGVVPSHDVGDDEWECLHLAIKASAAADGIDAIQPKYSYTNSTIKSYRKLPVLQIVRARRSQPNTMKQHLRS